MEIIIQMSPKLKKIMLFNKRPFKYILLKQKFYSHDIEVG